MGPRRFWARLANAKLRRAHRAGRVTISNSARALKRGGKRGLSADTQAIVREAIAALQEALKNGDAAAITQAEERLGTLSDKHLLAYRKAPWRETAELLALQIVIALLLRSFVMEAFKIPSGSMIPTLAIGDQIFVNKFIYGVRIPFTTTRLINFAPPQRGDVIVFICPVEPHEDYIKRVIGVAGDEIMVRDGMIFLNGEAVARRPLGPVTHWDRDSTGEVWRTFAANAFAENLGEHHYTVLQDADFNRHAVDFPTYVVPAGHVLMMGDNRDHSYDSRSWGPVPIENILGKSMFVWWSWGHQGVDVSRIGTWID